jgi:hypothetical protein
MLTNQKQIRAVFWAAHPDLEAAARARRTRSKPQNYQNATTRCAFVDFVDALSRSGQISDALANRATL